MSIRTLISFRTLPSCRKFAHLGTMVQLGRSSQGPAGVPEIEKTVGFLTTFEGREQRITDQEKGPDSELCRKALSSAGGTKKGKIIVVFFRLTAFRRVWFRPKMGLFYKFWAFPRGKKPGGMRKIRQKGGCLRWDMSPFSSEIFDFRVLSE